MPWQRRAARTAGVVGVLLTLLVSGLVPRALADDGDDDHDGEDRRAEARGTCSQDARWRLRAEAEDDRVEIRFVVRAGRRGGSWTYTIRDEGTVVAAGSRTGGKRGDRLQVRRTIPGYPAGRILTATARNPATREYCRAAVRL